MLGEAEPEEERQEVVWRGCAVSLVAEIMGGGEGGDGGKSSLD